MAAQDDSLLRIEILLQQHIDQDVKLYKEFSEKLTLTANNQKHILNEQDRINARLEHHFSEDKRNLGEVHKRLGKVEQRINYAAGGIALAAACLTFFWKALIHHFKG